MTFQTWAMSLSGLHKVLLVLGIAMCLYIPLRWFLYKVNQEAKKINENAKPLTELDKLKNLAGEI